MAKTEINLLPIEAQQQRAFRALLGGLGRFMRRIYLSLGILSVALVLVLAGVISIQEIVVDHGDESKGNATLEKSASGINALTTHMEKRIAFYDNWSVRTAEVLKQLPAEISLTTIKMAEKSGRIEIAGTADQRGAIKTFRERLETLVWVKTVEAPLQNYALGETAAFSFTLITKDDDPIP